MPRQYIVNSWVGSADYDEGDTYSGEMIGNRNQKSVGVHIKRSGDQWYANTAAYSDDALDKRKGRKKLSAFERICTAERAYDRLEKLSEDLDNEYERGILEHTDYAYARRQLDEKMSRAWKRVEKLRGWEDESHPKDDWVDGWDAYEYPENITPEILKPKEPKQRNIVNIYVTGNSVIDGLSDDNIFKKIGMIYYAIKKIVFNR